jgi:hypothetical protein
MPITAQTRAIQNYRTRLRKQGVARFEVLALESDRELIRTLAKRLTQNDPEAALIREQVHASVATEPAKKGNILAALRRSPLVGADLVILRPKTTSRPVDL